MAMEESAAVLLPGTSPRKKRRMSETETDDRFNSTLSFLSGTGPSASMSAVDNDMYSWMMFNSDLGNLLQPKPLQMFESAPPDDTELLSQQEEPLLAPTDGIIAKVETHTPRRQDSIDDSDFAAASLPDVHTIMCTSSSNGNSSNNNINTQNTSSSSSSQTAEESEKQRRREKQRIIARNFRKRKKERMHDLEKEVERLKAQNRKLQQKLLHNNHLQEPTQDLRTSHVKELQRLLSSRDAGKVDNIREIVNEHVAYFSDAGRMRKASVKHHVQELRKLMLPTQITKLCIWGLQQDDAFFMDRAAVEEASDAHEEAPSIWNILCRSLKLTEEQKQGIMRNRHRVGEQRDNIKSTIHLLGQLDKKISDTFKLNEGLLQSIMEQISPLQQAKYLLWQENNEACMQMLEHVWKMTDKQKATNG